MTEYKRVGAILSIRKDTKLVRFLGYGNYLGDEIPDDKARGLASACHLSGRPNPKIQLDNGEIVWGGECWWNDETKVQAQLRELVKEGYKVENIAINKIREEQNSP